jgi:hypothetical protein
MRKTTPLRLCVLLLAAFLLVGCGKKGSDEDEPRNPTLGPPERGGKGLKRVIDRPKVRNEVQQLAQLYTGYFADFTHYPKTVDEFKQYIKRDSPRLFEALHSGQYVLVLTNNPSSNAVLVYENDPDDKGTHIVAMGDASVTTYTTQQLKAALKKAN